MKNNTGKRIVKMILALILGAIVGLGFSIASTFATQIWGEKLAVADIALGFTPFAYGCIAVQVLAGIYLAVMRHRVKRDGYRDEEQSVYTQSERNIAIMQGIGTTVTIVFLPTAFMFWLHSPQRSLWFTACLLLVCGINLYNEVATIRLAGRVNRKFDVDWSKLSFNADLYQRMDECEREQAGKIGAFLVTHVHIIFLCIFLATLFLQGILAFSGYELLIVAMAWGLFMLVITWQKAKNS